MSRRDESPREEPEQKGLIHPYGLVYNYSYIQSKDENNRSSLTLHYAGYTMPPMNDSQFGVRVRRRRKTLDDMGQDRLAALVGISQPAINKIESGGRTRHGRKLAEALQTTLLWLETGSDPATDEHGNIINPDLVDAPPPRAGKRPKEWPFEEIDYQKVAALTPRELAQLEVLILVSAKQARIDIELDSAQKNPD